MRSKIKCAGFLAILGFCSCSDDKTPDATPADLGHPDAAAPDVDPVDVGFPDSGVSVPDAGPPPDSGVQFYSTSCAPCTDEPDCPGGLCVTRNDTGERFCADPCDGDLAGCVTGFTCFDINQDPNDPRYYCLSPMFSCEMDGTAYGGACFGDTTGCAPRTDHCEGDFHNLGYCTSTCENEADCPNGYACRDGDEGGTVCVPLYQSLAETCARSNDGELPCALDEDCASLPDAVCVRSEMRLPGVCAVRCGSGCTEQGQTCQSTHRGEVCLSERCSCHAQQVTGSRDLLNETLDALGLSRCSALFNIFDWATVAYDVLVDPYRLSFFDPIHNEPLRAPAWADGVVNDLESRATAQAAPTYRAARLVEALAEQVDRPAVQQPPGAIDPISPLSTALAELITEAGGSPDTQAIEADAQDIPLDLQLEVARVLDAARRGVAARRSATGNRTPSSVERIYEFIPAFVAQREDGRGLIPSALSGLLNEEFDYGAMYGAGVDMLEAIAQSDLARFAQVPSSTTATTTATLLFSQDTPLGRVAIGDGQSGLYDERNPGFDGPWALLIDLGGNDEYRVSAGGNATKDNWVSVLIDLDGNDLHGYVEVPHPRDEHRLVSDADGRYSPSRPPEEDYGPISFSNVARQGGARLGTAVLVDLGGDDDHYQSLRMSQGFGVLGTGVLVDDGGNDTYLAESTAQGSGCFGIGLLFDLGGDDVRMGYTMSQGFAFARAAGLLYDLEGTDQYLLDVGDPSVGGDPLYISAQRPGRANSTMGQGFAFGRRADATDRAFMSGGLGILIDGAGDDRYEGSIFAQGGGYWFGTGILADRSGNDHYDSMWYGMGAGAHFAMGLLLERSGNDVYGGTLPKINVTVAGAHDFTVAFLIDEEGDDIYNGSRITLGTGNVNGHGFLIDNAGDDSYLPDNAYSLGNAGLTEGQDPGGARRKVDTIGVFIDAGGNDTYLVGGTVPEPGIENDSAWVQSHSDDPELNVVELGAGIDAEGDSSIHLQ